MLQIAATYNASRHKRLKFGSVMHVCKFSPYAILEVFAKAGIVYAFAKADIIYA